MARFPSLKGAPDAFGSGRELYEQIPGEFDQTRWAASSARAKLMSVPWCGDYDNVVAFADDGARDAWIDEQEGYAFETSWRRPPELTYKVEVPYTSALLYNYLVLDLPTPTSDAEPLPGASGARVSRLCYFVMDARPSAGSTTELEIELDVWTTFIGSVDVSYLQLEQGHAPMAEVTPDEFLASPMARSTHLLAPDVGAAGATVAASAHACEIDSETVTLVITTSQLDGAWGDRYGATPAEPVSFAGAPASPEAWAVTDPLETFLTDVVSQHPSFLQTVLAIASAPASLVTLGAATTFCGHEVRLAQPRAATLPLVDLEASDFGYDEAYAGIAKLYTYPYAHLEIADETGGVSVVRVEETTGSLDVMAQLSLAWGYVAVDTTVSGIGRASAALSWTVLGRAASATLAGRWYETLRSHEVPLFSVRESSATSYDWSAHHTNEQRELAAQNAYASETASASTANANALASNATARSNASNSASNITANNAVAVANASANADVNANAAYNGTTASNAKINQDVAYDLLCMIASYESEQGTLAQAATNNRTLAAMGVAGSAAGGVASVIASGLSGDMGGAVGSAVGTFAQIASQTAQWGCADASIAITQSNSTTIYNAQYQAATGKESNAESYARSAERLATNAATDITTNNNSASTSIASNNASLINTNATNTKTTADANANRTLATANANAGRTRDTALAAIQNDTEQAALGDVVTHGEQRPGSSGVRPMLVQATVVTQAPGEIALAGDHMLRYGYACDFAWHVSDWCPCERFCYWRASDVWMGSRGNVAERYQRKIKDILLRGTTVWKRPEDIGSVSVHDNGF